MEQSTASSLWHKSLLWSLKHNKARVPPTQHPLSYTPGPDSKIIPIMQHVCDCRNPLWPFWSSLRRTVPETWCQAASDGTLPTPNPQHTRWPRFPSFSPPSRTAWGVFYFFVPSFDTDVSRWCRAQGAPPGLCACVVHSRIQALILLDWAPRQIWEIREQKHTQTHTSFKLQTFPLNSPELPIISDERRLGIYQQKQKEQLHLSSLWIIHESLFTATQPRHVCLKEKADALPKKRGDCATFVAPKVEGWGFKPTNKLLVSTGSTWWRGPRQRGSTAPPCDKNKARLQHEGLFLFILFQTLQGSSSTSSSISIDTDSSATKFPFWQQQRLTGDGEQRFHWRFTLKKKAYRVQIQWMKTHQKFTVHNMQCLSASNNYKKITMNNFYDSLSQWFKGQSDTIYELMWHLRVSWDFTVTY